MRQHSKLMGNGAQSGRAGRRTSYGTHSRRGPCTTEAIIQTVYGHHSPEYLRDVFRIYSADTQRIRRKTASI
jgi:hypothetical protein